MPDSWPNESKAGRRRVKDVATRRQISVAAASKDRYERRSTIFQMVRCETCNTAIIITIMLLRRPLLLPLPRQPQTFVIR